MKFRFFCTMVLDCSLINFGDIQKQKQSCFNNLSVYHQKKNDHRVKSSQVPNMPIPWHSHLKGLQVGRMSMHHPSSLLDHLTLVDGAQTRDHFHEQVVTLPVY